ncbi:hypothetical protein [Afipia sp. Root123D2]|uniref:hypothetical protein n=1 Tax=Afipia sp. Root123D2 TaxID=1736436 RepID=UPI0009E76D66|nr:hypothetical protein [Afipia sp. Root123D2]
MPGLVPGIHVLLTVRHHENARMPAMTLDRYSVASGISKVLALICAGLSFLLAIAAFTGSRETGAGAAQGDLGFFMLLVPATVVIFIALILAVLLRLLFSNSKGDKLFWVIGASAVFGVIWDWSFLLLFWRH